jgi:hypothetical protein
VAAPASQPSSRPENLHPRLIEHLQSGQVSRIVYGSIIGLALVLTLEAHPPSVAATIGTLVATALAVALAELYSEVIGARARAGIGGHIEPRHVIIEDAAAVALGIAFPGIFFVLVLLNVLDYDTAFKLAKWTGLTMLAGYGYVAARLSGSDRMSSLLQALWVTAIAVALIVAKALLH